MVYGKTEFHFDGDRDDDCLFLIYREVEVAGAIVPELSVKLDLTPNLRTV